MSSVVLITGASSGIGEALAREYASKGARLVLCARRKDKLDGLALELGGPGRALAIECDVRARSSLDRAVAATIAAFGRIDVVVANAGFGVYGEISGLTSEDFTRQFDTNVFGVFNTVQATLSELKKSQGRYGIVGSAYSYFTFPGTAPYTMSKYAVRAFAESLYFELAPVGVSVTLLCPGIIGTEFRKIDNSGRLKPERNEMIPAFAVMPASVAARKIRRAIEARKREAIVTLHAKIGVLIRNHLSWFYALVIRLASNKILGFLNERVLEKTRS